MSLSKQEINEKYAKEHAALTERYYVKKEISKTDFEVQHADLWRRHEEELINAGFRKWQWTYVFGKVMDDGSILDVESRTLDCELTPAQIQALETKYNRKLLETLKSSVDI